MTELGVSGGVRGNFGEGAARACNSASEQCYEHPRARKPSLLPNCFVSGATGGLIGDDGVVHRHDLMDEAPTQALAVGRQLALAGGLSPSGRQISLARFQERRLLPCRLIRPCSSSLSRLLSHRCRSIWRSSGRIAWTSGMSAAHNTSRRGVPSRGTMARVEGREVQANRILAHRVFGLLIRHERRAPVARSTAGSLRRHASARGVLAARCRRRAYVMQ
jgi:hypothetical protein